MRNATVMPYRIAEDVALVRAFVREQAHRLGLTADPVESLVIAVNELVTNTLQHTAAGGQVRIWAEATAIYCEVVDSGPIRSFGRAMPAAEAERGRGLAIVERLCDEVTVRVDPGGTTVRLRFPIRSADGSDVRPAARGANLE